MHFLCGKKFLSMLGGSYIDSPDWIKSKKATTNSMNKKDDKCCSRFQYAAAVALNHEKTGKSTGKISKIKPFIDKCNWEGINNHKEKMTRKNVKR